MRNERVWGYSSTVHARTRACARAGAQREREPARLRGLAGVLRIIRQAFRAERETGVLHGSANETGSGDGPGLWEGIAC